MSKVWGNGFHKGIEQGMDRGMELGETVGGFQIAEQSYHCVNAAIASIEIGADLQALTILRLLRPVLEQATGRIKEN